jgi:N-glycosylase/DNA lyase
MKQDRYRNVAALLEEYERRQTAIRRRLEEFASVPATEYFYELVYCLLTPQSSAVNAARAVSAMQEADVFGRGADPAPILFRKEAYIRFHNTKARRILEAREHFQEIAVRLAGNSPGRAVREWLVVNVKGMGWKEASHFLRNIGYRNLAILDRHILRNLKLHGVIRSYPASLTPKRYLAIERAFEKFAAAVEIPMDELDLLFWSRETGEILK